jgi:GT2 family glycosyltransferase
LSRLRLTICYLTGRLEPRIEWAVEAIRRQRRKKDVIELLVVDTHGRSSKALVPDATGVDRVVVVAPKPNLWQGKHRVASRDLWAKSQSANTALCLAKHDYVAFLDDRCVLGDRWLATVRAAADERESVLAGAYERVLEADRKELDHRLELSPEGKVNCGGTWLYGCTFALPLAWALKVNGFEEGMDGLAQEDCVFGFQLENAGYRIDFEPALFVTLHREAEMGHAYARSDGEKFEAALKRFRGRKRTEFTPNLKRLRKAVRSGESFPVPDPREEPRDWYDGSALGTRLP